MNATELTARVAIIGAGFSGIAAAVALRNKGIEDFVIFEKAPGIGGTWWSNRYPGAEVDLESHVYSFSYERRDWSRGLRVVVDARGPLGLKDERGHVVAP